MSSFDPFNVLSMDFLRAVVVSPSDIFWDGQDLSIESLEPWVGVLLALILWMMPLTGVDRGHNVTRAMYWLFVAASALVIALLFLKVWIAPYPLGGLGLVIGVSLVIADLRWRPAHTQPETLKPKGESP